MIRSVTPEAPPERILDASDARRFASEIIRAGCDDEFDARAVLNEHPELRDHTSAVLDLVYEEYSRRVASGETLDSDEFADRFPEHRGAVLEHIRAHGLLERCFGDGDFGWPVAGEIALGCELLEEIGRGTFSRVFQARQTALGDRNVVVKFCPGGAHEAHLLGKLEHEHIVPVHAVGTDYSRRLTAIVMPYLGRATLLDIVDSGFSRGAAPALAQCAVDAVRRRNGVRVEGSPPDATVRGSYGDAVVRIMLDVARGLAHAHRKGVLHADIKPSNVLVTEALRAKLLDFNLSHEPGSLTNMTGGTVPYMAPEQLLALAHCGEPAPTAAADMYAFGVTFFEALAGRSPYGSVPVEADRTRLAQWLLRRREEGWDTLDRAAPYAPRTVRRLIARCLSFDPRDRPVDFDAVADVLAAELRPIARALRFVQRHPRWTAVAGLVAALVFSLPVISFALADPAYQTDFASGRRFLAAGDYARAAEQFDAAERGMPADAPVEFQVALWFERGLARLRRQSSSDLDGAFRDFRRVIALDPRHAAAHAGLGYAYLADYRPGTDMRDFDGQFIKALSQFRLARAHGLDTPELRYDIAFCQFQVREERAAGIVGLQEIVRASGKHLPRDVLGASLFVLAQAALTNASVDFGETEVARLIETAGHCGPVHLLAAHLTLRRAANQSVCGDTKGSAESLAAAAESCRRAVQHGVDQSEIDRTRSMFPVVADDPRFVDVPPAGPPIESTESPRLVLDPLAGVSPQ